MKLFWKLFFSIISVTMIVFCISGHLLIYSSFQSFLEKESQRLAMANAAFAYSFETAAEKNYNLEMMDAEEVAENILSISFSGMSDILQLVVRDEAGTSLYQKTEQFPVPDREIEDSAKPDIVSYKIKESEGRYYVHCASLISVGRWKYDIETISEVTPVFIQKEEQYRIYKNCMLGLAVLTAVFVLALAIWITRPIRKLTQAVQQIGNGDYTKRILARGHDEVSELACKFNWMTGQLEKNMQDLKAAVSRQEEFIGSFSHEMKTPLTSIIGYSDMLRSKPMTEEERMVYGDYIFRQGKRLEKLSGRMLELIVLEKTDIEMQKVNIKNILETIQEELWPVLDCAEIILELKAEPFEILAEPTLLKTVFLNMIDNSKKAIEHGGIIRIWTEEESDRIKVCVWDNGKGIAKEDLEKVTESFYMGDKSRKYEKEGVGLGLSICRKILDIHKADMKIESKQGEETKISIWFKKI